MFWGLQTLKGAAEAPLTSRVISLCLKVLNYWVRDSILRSRSSASLKPAPACSLTRPPAPQEQSSCLPDLSHPSCKSAPSRALLAQFRHCLGPSRSPALTPAYLFFSLSAVIVAVFLRDPEHLGSLGP